MNLYKGDTYRIEGSHINRKNLDKTVQKFTGLPKSLTSGWVIGLEAVLGVALSAIAPAILPELIGLAASQGFAAAASALRSLTTAKSTPVNNPLTSTSSAPTLPPPSAKPLGVVAFSKPKGSYAKNVKFSVSQGVPPMSYKAVKRTGTTVAPVAKGVKIATSNRPRIRSKGRGVVISHSEMIGTITSSSVSGAYECDSWVINPGKFSTTPWLATMACNYDKYRFISLVARVISNQPTSTAGRIGIGIDYDSTDPQPADRMEFFSLTHHAEGAAWDSLVFPVPQLGGVRFVNSHTVSDSKLIDVGQLLVFADQIVATSTSLADVILDYTVELIDPQQAVYATQGSLGANVAPSALSTYGPVLGSITQISTKIAQYNVGPGIYMVSVVANDGGGGTPTISTKVSAGNQGWHSFNSTTTYSDGLSYVKLSTAGASFQVVCALDYSALEYVNINVTRISAAVLASWYAGGTTNFTASTTY